MFRRFELIRFQHCDPAGIVFYPRYVEMINATVEDWFDHIGLSFADIHGPMNIAIPAVSLNVEFKAPSRLAERIELQLTVERIGTSSVNLAIDAIHGGEQRFLSKVTLVHISKEDYRSRTWPETFLNAMAGGQ